ncbi:Amino acid transporter [Clostridium cavendishii DSM 21758]|uniref:Amino acid transporter n=1 Tax=Clostridium cavendishii DSM 21758 TaxID=1121302 RepID=A0A1M6R9M0_9CLOT|nr:tyrosine-tyramine antiporter [Clostridium cavendishii]SHK29120.1 Amino acid transporter [Clostridium cavendishii DSM 21758]
MENGKKKLTLFQLIGISIAFYGSVRSVPTLAVVGWQQIFFMVGAAVLFAIPISLISAELATGWPEEGGSQVWVKEALGEKFGFVTSWLLWVQMFFGMVMVSSTVGVLLGYVIGRPDLSQNNIFVFAIIIISYWTVTLLNLKYDMDKVVGSIGSVVGIYIPFVALVALGLWWSFKHGIVNLGTLNWGTAIPSLSSVNKLSIFSGIIFIFAGLEIASVHANNIENPKKNYPISVFLSMGLLIIFNLIAGLTEANAIPADKIQLSNITQPFEVYFNELGLPWLTNVISAMIAIGVLAQLSAWVLGPSKAMIKVAEDGNLPPVFQKRTKRGVPITFVLIQATVVSLVGVLYVIIPDVNSSFFMILILTTILYCIVYLMIILSGIILKYKRPEVERAFTIPGGNFGMWITAILALSGTVITLIVSLIPPENTNPTMYLAVQIVGTIICVVSPLIIFKLRKPSWKKNSEDNAA